MEEIFWKKHNFFRHIIITRPAYTLWENNLYNAFLLNLKTILFFFGIYQQFSVHVHDLTVRANILFWMISKRKFTNIRFAPFVNSILFLQKQCTLFVRQIRNLCVTTTAFYQVQKRNTLFDGVAKDRNKLKGLLSVEITYR